MKEIKFIHLCMFLMLGTLASVTQAQTQMNALKRIQDETGFVNKLGENKAGIEYKHRSGMPGEGIDIILRGVKSLFKDSKPLIIVDGMIFDDSGLESPLITGSYMSPLSAINVHEILNINVLQGADALKYGALGVNGVVEITTKYPDLFETTIEISSQVGITSLAKQLEQMDANQFRNYAMDVLSTSFSAQEVMSGFPGLFVQPGHVSYETYNHNTNWQDEIFESAFSTRNNIQVKAGDDIAKYFLTMGYSKNNGIVKNSSEEVYNIRLNSELAIHKNVLAKVGLAFNESNSTLFETGFSFNNNPIASALAKSPLLSPMLSNSDGIEQVQYDPVREFRVSNPIAIINDNEAKGKTTSFLGNFKLDVKLNNRLKVELQTGLNIMKNSQDNFVSGWSSGAILPSITNGAMAYNSVKHGMYELNTFEVKGDIHYKLLDSESKMLDVVAGIKYYQSEMYNNYAIGINTGSDEFKVLDWVSTSASRLLNGESFVNKMFEYKAELRYSFEDLLTVILNANYNGVSNVGSDVNKFSLNGGGQIAFNVGEMLEVESADILSRLNVNLGYGRFSSNNLPFIGIDSYYKSKPFDNIGGLVRANIGNDQLKRETVDKMNVGLNLGLFGDILDIDVNYFYDKSNDLVMAIPAEEFTGFATMYDNVGSMTNKGITVFAKANIINTKDLGWSLGGDFSTYKNEINSITGGSIVTSVYGCDLITKEGGSAYEFYGLKSLGIIHDAAEAATLDLEDEVGNKYLAGDMLYDDVNNDDIIDNADRVAIGNPNPDYFGNIFTSLRYKDFSFSLNVKYNIGGDIFNYQRSRNEGQIRPYNQSVAVASRYRDAPIPYRLARPQYSESTESIVFSDNWIEDGSYVKLSDVTLSYNLKNIYKKTSALFYVQGQNLLVGTKYLGYDPEFQYGDRVMSRGIDYGQMPMGRTILFGVKLSL